MSGVPPSWCSAGARERGDELVGTAPRAERWLLVEQPGPWGRDALRQSRLDRGVADEVAATAAQLQARPVVVRRPGRSVEGERLWALVDCRRQTWRWGTWRQGVELLRGLSGAVQSAGEGDPCPDLWLVCTHGRHDRCCAVRGRPVAAALSALAPATAVPLPVPVPSVWECSHVGGDRFAANVVSLPTGTYYGWVEPHDLPGLLAAQADGRVDLARWRGRCTLPPAVQAAQQHARRQLGLDRLDDLPALGCRQSDDGGWQVRLVAGADVVEVRLRQERAEAAGRLTCAAASEALPPRWRIDDVRVSRNTPPGGIVPGA